MFRMLIAPAILIVIATVWYYFATEIKALFGNHERFAIVLLLCFIVGLLISFFLGYSPSTGLI